MDMVTVGGIIT